jgi:hypothetical protein
MKRPPFRFDFRSRSGTSVNVPAVWLREWSEDFPKGKYPSLDSLLAKATYLTAADFHYLGRWKDNALESANKWQPNVASVAFVIWMQAANELAGTRIDHIVVPSFLTEWSSKAYVDRFSTGIVIERFGLPRATTILHVLSGGEYPIFDSRVQRAFRRLTGEKAHAQVEWYLGSYVPFFSHLVSVCSTKYMKAVDNALFVYGRKQPYFQ